MSEPNTCDTGKSAAQQTVVVIDDDYDVLEWCRLVLEPAGFAVCCFSDPESALTAMDDARPDAIITDLMMAHLDSGFDFARRVRSTPALARVPIIIMTAASSRHGFDFTPQSAADLAAMNVDAFFAKPAAPQALIAKLRELIAKSRETPPCA